MCNESGSHNDQNCADEEQNGRGDLATAGIGLGIVFKSTHFDGTATMFYKEYKMLQKNA